MTRTSTPTRWNGTKTLCASYGVPSWIAIAHRQIYRRIYVDSRLNHMLMLKLDKSFWDRGDFPPVVQNGSQTVILNNPWVNGTKAAPFDQRELDRLTNAIRSVINPPFSLQRSI